MELQQPPTLPRRPGLNAVRGSAVRLFEAQLAGGAGRRDQVNGTLSMLQADNRLAAALPNRHDQLVDSGPEIFIGYTPSERVVWKGDESDEVPEQRQQAQYVAFGPGDIELQILCLDERVLKVEA